MIFYLLLFNILCLPLIDSSDITVSKPEIPNKTVSESPKVNLSNETKVTLLSEGGALLPETSIFALPKEKLTNINSEFGKNKLSPVVARKGVVYIEDEHVKPQQQKASNTKNNSTSGDKIPEKADTSHILVNNSTNKGIHLKANETLLNKITSDVKHVNKVITPKKPLILSYDTLANMTVKPSPETIIPHQRPSKILAKSANSHPGMIMPIVITILLVPMFAVLGYMALRRGQEAWKNRHYKRMDFLLDGMYND